MEKKYFYFVVWFGTYASKQQACGHAEIMRDKKIRGFEDLREISEEIKKRNKLIALPTIINFKLFRIENVPE